MWGQSRHHGGVRVAACLLLVVTLVSSCSDDGKQRAAATTTSTTTTSTTTTTEVADCTTTPSLPKAADGSSSQLVTTVGDVQIAIVDHGASVDVVSLFVQVDCRLQAATVNGTPAVIPIGGTVTHGDGLACSDDRFEVLTATSDDGATYQATATTYRLDGTELVAVEKAAATIEAQTDPETLSTYYRLDC